MGLISRFLRLFRNFAVAIVLLWSAGAFAQTALQPVYVRPKAGTAISVFSSKATTGSSAVYDMTAYRNLFLIATSAATCTTSTLQISTSSSASGTFTNIGDPLGLKTFTSAATSTYFVSGLSGFVRFDYTTGEACELTLTVLPIPFSETSRAIGSVAAGTNAGTIYPVMVGGTEGTSARTMKTDSTGTVQVDIESITAGNTNIGNVDIASMGTAATIDTEATGQAADYNVEAGTTGLRLVGWTVRESAASASTATVILRHGSLSGGNCTSTATIAYIELAANQSVGDSYPDRGLAVPNGICADVVAGTVDVNVFTVVEAAP